MTTPAAASPSSAAAAASGMEPVAIIGVGMRLPGADRLDAFWRHLADRRALISEVPARRWDAAALKGNPAKGNFTSSIWGGFVEDADCFDAPFFNVSPREAAWMDPQQRLALETAWHAIEDAGYAAGTLAGSRTGVYMGVCHWDYAELLEKHLATVDAYTPTGIAFSIIANRVSHFFDFQGPSITNDTACAASMTALYEAVRALQNGECDQALAGGVNLIWSPNHFVAFSKAGMLSREGRGKAFDERADGYVRGEGAATLLLKPLSRAVADGDPIHAVIRGIGVNHGGRTNSLTVTNPKAQAALIAEVHQGAGVAPDTVDYIEAHGPGTPLGDPIEISGLKQAFAALHEAAGTQPAAETVGIGSVKTNIGHLEGAAGVAGVVKVLAAMRHGLLPGNVGFETLNRLIDLSGTSFRIQADMTPWPRRDDRPRRAGVSSFGFGGSNAHVLLEDAPAAVDAADRTGPVVLPLSARTDDRLAAYAEAVADALAAEADPAALADVAYTFQVGREAMDVRRALVAEDRKTLVVALRAVAAGEPHAAIVAPDAGAAGDDPAALAARWAAGEAVDWRVLHDPQAPPRRVHAPLYPFARERHWMDEALAAKDDRPVPHPLVHRNVSGFDGPRFQAVLKDSAFVWADHHVGEVQVLPGVASLEMARAALSLAEPEAPAVAGLALEDVAWTRPLRGGAQPVTVEVRLTRRPDGAVAFAVQEPDAAPHAQGRLVRTQEEAPAALDLAALRKELAEDVPVAECYRRLVDSGVAHGPTYRALARVLRGAGQVLAQLKLPRRLLPTLDVLPLHPVLLDAAIQAWVALDDAPAPGAAVPFACRRVTVHGACPASLWAHVRPTPGTRDGGAVRHLGITLCDKDGGVRVEVHDLVLRMMHTTEAPAEEAPPPVVFAAPVWQPAPLATAAAPRETTVLLAGWTPAVADDLAARTGLAVARLPGGVPDDLAATAQAWIVDLNRRLAGMMREAGRTPRQLLVIAPDDLPAPLTAPLAASLRTAAVENPKVGGAVVTVPAALAPQDLAALLTAEAGRADTHSDLRHHDGRREALRPEARPLPAASRAPVDPEGAYWITGGLGGLGLIFADWLVGRGARHVVLTGRRAEPGDEAAQRIAALRAAGATVHIAACDVTDAAAVTRTARWIAQEVAPLKGVIHAAGVLDDGYILTRDPEAAAAGLAPKVAGLVALDAATADAPLDFMVLCSSVAAAFGNAGQSFYAAANAFMDGFAEDRAARVAAGARQGATVAVSWPLWAEGGMTVDAPTLAAMERRFGTTPLPTKAGLAALDAILSAPSLPRGIVLYGDDARIHAMLDAEGAPLADPAAPAPASSAAAEDDASLTARAIDFVREVLAELLQMEPERIRANRKLEEYGLDSIVIVEATNRLEEALGPVSKTLFFEYVDLAGLAAHLVEDHREALVAALGSEPAPAPAQAQPDQPAPPAAPLTVAAEPRATAPAPEPDDRHDIAIVGLSLRVSRATTPDELWEMLAGGEHGFRPYPQERWNHAALLHPERDVLGKTVVRTGTFLDGIDRFDPRYFRISQAEAELMAPEVRLFLEASVEAFEDAGYSRETMQRRLGGDVAVIVGSMSNEYDLYGFQNMLLRGAPASGSYTGTVPNMVSYYYGLTGPSYFLDTMCSAASTCVHEAVHMLRAGRCRMALAGGVNLMTHPQKLIATSQEHFTTKTADVIRGYGLGADGTILGEGVGAVVLKTLADAERDGDHIYGVIRGTGISNAGVRNGFTVPNPAQQAVAIEQALDDAGIDAGTISYVEGHGSGTALGDPIEVKALTRAFRRHTQAKGFCPLGTVKSNVAHLLGASGLAGIAKVLLQLRHGQLAPSLNAETLNPNIPFDDTPFVVQRTLAPWVRPRDASGAEVPRRAGVTSIGAGGMNSHIIIEEHRGGPARPPAEGQELLVFSAMNPQALGRVVERFRAHVTRHPDLRLDDVAYTLQVGRTELPCRLALVAEDLATAAARLAGFAEAPAAGEGLVYTRSVLDADPDTDAARLAAALRARDLPAVAAAWACGAAVDWDLLHEGRRPRRVPLPTYPFERVRCWYPEHPEAPSVLHPLGARLKLHPLVGVNESDRAGLRYTTAIHLDELLDYACTEGRRRALVPTVVVEVAAAVAHLAGLPEPVGLRDLVVRAEPAWDTVAGLRARLEGTDAARVVLETVDATGTASPWAEAQVTQAAAPAAPVDLAEGGRVLDAAAINVALAGRGLGFKPYGEVLETARLLPGGGVVVTVRAEPPQQDPFKRRQQLPAPVLVAAFQALCLALPEETAPTLSGVSAAWTMQRDPTVTRILLRPAGAGLFDLLFLDADGAAVAAWEGLRVGPITETAPAPEPREAAPTPAVAAEAPDARIAGELRALAADILKFPAADVSPRESFHDLGFDSISLTRLAGDVSEAFNVDLSPAIFFECEHVEALAHHLVTRHGVTPKAAEPPARPAAQPAAAASAPVVRAAPAPVSAPAPEGAVAIVGMAGRFPGARDVDAFFDALLAGRDLTGDLPLERYAPQYAARMRQAGFPRRGGFLSDIDRFDAAFFKVSPVEAERMDPQQRLMLETAWHAIENAGYRPDELPRDTGVFVGVTALDYAALLREHGAECDGYVATGNSLAMVANRLSHVLDVHGPSQAIDTACSSSLVALLRAAEAVRAGRCSAAVVGGVNLCLGLEGFAGPHKAGMLSPEGRCKTFGAGADGYARGEGVAALLVKPLAAAERDGDRILGLLVGGAENHGGRAGSLTAPNVKAQAALIEQAMTGLDPRSVSYIEAHGTGTNLGDPVEVNGLHRAYAALLGEETVAAPFIGLGTVKSAIGHLEAAAGLAGVVKVLMALQREELPPTLHCESVNPHIDLAGSPFRLVRTREAWPRGTDAPRRAGVSSFGFGGTNAHVVLQEAPAGTEPRRRPLPPTAFAPTRFWLPGVARAGSPAMMMVPRWVEAPATVPAAPARRIVVSCGVAVAAGQGAEVRVLSAHGPAEAARYVAAARDLLGLLRTLLAEPDAAPVLVQLVVPAGEAGLFSGLGAMLDTAAAEAPRLSGQVVEVPAESDAAAVARLLACESGSDSRVRHENGRRLVRAWREMAAPATPHRWRERGVYLITGGTGGLGRQVARDIAKTARGAVLVLVGASALNAAREAVLEEVRALGAVAAYRRVDVADPVAVRALVRHVLEVHGTLTGVVHCAGTLRDGFLLRKSEADLDAVLAPKVAGALALHDACAGLDLECFVLFSSLAGAVGNVGQACYAAANGALDALARRQGPPVVSVNWPLWRDGGMTVDAATEEALFRRMGQRPLETAAGLSALHAVLAAREPHAAVIAGDTGRIRSFFGLDAAPPPPAPAPVPAAAEAVSDAALAERAQARLRDLFAKVSGVAAERIEVRAPLEDYGIDSLMITRLNEALADQFGPLPKTLFFQYRSLAAVARYLAESHTTACRLWTGLDAAPPSAPAPAEAPAPAQAPAPNPAPAPADEPIAVVGMSGRYPGAPDLDAFWTNLAEGRDAVGEIPADRWPLAGFHHPDPDEAVERGLSYARHGAFLEGFADFDPQVFKLSPREAAAMDPQERLFLMSAWAACEDAGYSRARLRAVAGTDGEGGGARVGVFAGVTKTGYALHGPFTTEDGARVRPTTSFAGIANRVSHVLDLSGPSMPIDTMCSSSLTAIHEACEHLRAGSCAMALAGGVNLYLHPNTYIELSAARMLSRDGRCKSFGAGADGFVPGEGVGCLLLKPLSKALADGDRIHAVIRGSAVNHGGHTNGYTVPNPAAQRDLVRAALAKAGLPARAVTCIEAHGTGTSLGDPVEVAGLTEAFRADTADAGFCALGSVKSAIGHLEAAAGIAGLTKIILQMKHRTLAPTLHAEAVNPNLDLAGSPFVLQRAAAPWQAEGPRVAGVSSFGAGGANAHVVVEEWPAPATDPVASAGPQAIVLSARDPERLRESAERLLRWLERAPAQAVAAQDPLPALQAHLAAALCVAPDDIDPAEPLDALGLDAAQRLGLRRFLEDWAGEAMDPAVLAQADTLEALAALLRPDGATAAAGGPSLAAIAYTLQVGREPMACRLGIEAADVPELTAALRAWLAGRTDHPGLHVGRDGAADPALTALLGEAALRDMAAQWWREGRVGDLLRLWTAGLDVDWLALPRPDRPAIVSPPSYPFARQRFWLPERRDALAAAITAPAGDAALAAASEGLERHVAQVLRAVLAEVPADAVVPAYGAWHAAACALVAGTPALTAAEAWAAWEAHKASGGPAAQMALAETALRALPEILTGRAKATDVLFPEGSLRLVEAVYKDNAVAARFSRTLAEAAAAAVRAKTAADPSARLRILEIGAGTGGTSEPVFAALEPVMGAVAEYCYTDVSRAFLIHAERTYAGRVPGLRTALLDVEKPLGGQGVAAGAYDVVIAANVLHATADMRRTMAVVREAMAPGGLLLVNETSMATLFTHVTFGLLDGWWRFTDPEVRIPGTPSLSADSWRAVLEDSGFAWVAGSSGAERALGQQIIAARAVGEAAAAPPPAPAPAAPVPAPTAAPASAGSLRDVLLAVLGETLNVSPQSIAVDQSFADYGLDSILGAELVHRLKRRLGVTLDQTRLFDFATVAQLETFLAAEYPEAATSAPPPKPAKPAAAPAAPVVHGAARSVSREPIAIVGFSGRFAKSETVADLWDHLMAGRDLVTEPDRFDPTPPDPEAAAAPHGRKGSFLDGVDRFDPVFFGISGLEATYMDPQQRLFLEEAWKTLEHAGHAGADMVGRRCGVFVGASHGDYQELFRRQPPGQAFWGNTASLIPARIAYWLDLKGPAVAVDTACSSSLTAVHMACQSLWSGESEMALAGGVFVQSTARFFRYANQARMLSPTGRCAAFGAGADGIVPGEAVAAVLLRPLSEALADGDTVHGVIVASGLNQDGTTNGITAPSAASQESLIRRVYDDFGIDPATIGMVEAHGTGTVLGDPIEHAALVRAYDGDRLPRRSIALGSVKSNIGHATTAAGIAGLVKALLCLKAGAIPPTLHFAGGNPAIPFGDGPFHVPTEPLPWTQTEDAPRRAAVSSFGFSGTNAHVVVEDAPATPTTPDDVPAHLFVLSARSAAQVRQQAERLADYLERTPDLAAGDVAHTLLVGRRHFHERLAVVAANLPDLVRRLRGWLAGDSDSGVLTARLDDRDHREDPAATADGAALIDRLSPADAAAWAEGLARLAALHLRGCRLPFERLFPAGRRRVPLPAYPFATTRFWVEDTTPTPPPEPPKPKREAPELAPAPKPQAAGPVRLAAPAAVPGSFAPVPAGAPRIRLAPLKAAPAPVVTAAVPPQVRRVDVAAEGVWRLDLAQGVDAARLAEELSAAAGNPAVRAVLLVAEGVWPETVSQAAADAIRACTLPVVLALPEGAAGSGAAAALEADILVLSDTARLTGPASAAAHRLDLSQGPADAPALKAAGFPVVPADRVAETARSLAAALAEAPREPLVALKAHMREALPTLKVGRSTATAALTALAGSAPAGEAGPARRVPLRSPVMELQAHADGVVVLRMVERAEKNTFTDAFMDGITEAFAAIAAMPEAKVVVLTGHDGYFACGGTRSGLTDLQRGATSFTDRRIYCLPLDCPLPVIAAMQGHGIGAGWSLGLYCDTALLAAEGVYHSNYLWFGFTPGAGATLVFPHRLGDDLGREVLFTAREYRGRDLAGRAPEVTVLPGREVLPRALDLAHRLARQPRDRLLALKAEHARPLAAHLDTVLARELAMHQTTFVGSDRVRARIEEKFPEAPQPAAPAPAPAAPRTPDVRRQVVESLAEDLMIPAAEIRDDAGFLDLGLDSILAVTWIRRLNGLLEIDLPATVVYAHPTVGALVAHVAGLVPAAEPQPQPEPTPAPPRLAPEPAAAPAPAVAVRGVVVDSLAEDLMIPAAEIRDDAGFLDLGLDSILAVTWIRRLNGLLNIDLPATAVYAHPTVGALVAHVAGLVPAAPAPAVTPKSEPTPPPAPKPPPVPAAPAVPAPEPEAEDTAIAIIGASGRFPKADDLDAFWDNIRSGRDCIDEVPADRWDVERFYHPDPQHPGTSYCKWMGAIGGVDRFDPAFFNMTPREAELMDPQQRLFLQHAWHAVEDAGRDPFTLGGSRCGVYVASGPSGYADLIVERNAYSLLGSSGSILAARIAHLLDLQGPSLSIDTACSSSLVAVVEACNSLRSGETDLALAGGACALIGPSMFIDCSKVGMLSPDGRCFTFDARANGFVPGEGVGVVMLKRLADARRDGDPVRAVLRGWGINQDGRTNGITAPNPQAQARLIREVHARFGIDPASIGLIEAHGTGTALGDPIEVEGLTDAFQAVRDRAESVTLGSVKSNVGHLLAAAGVAGLLKAMLALEHAELPPTVNFETRNSHIRLDGTPFRVATDRRPWPAEAPRRAAVSSFGFSGTNAHAVLEAAPPAAAPPAGAGPWIFVLSARTRARLLEYTAETERFVAGAPDLALADLAHTLQVGRTPLPSRLAFVFRDRDDLLRRLASVSAGQPLPGVHLSDGDREAVALFDADEDARALPSRWLASGAPEKLERLAALWSKGLVVDWSAAPAGRRIRLPGYPFARDRHWVTPPPPAAPEPAPVEAAEPHPLLDGAAERGTLARFSLPVQREGVALTTHDTGTERRLLGLSLPELARVAVARATGRPVTGLRHLVWGAPLTVNGRARVVDVTVAADAEGVLYRISADGADAAPCHLGEVPGAEDALAMPEPVDARSWASAGADVSDAFRAFAAACAVQSGPAAAEASAVRWVRRDGDVLLAHLVRPASAPAMPFDPAHLDAAWRLAAFRRAGWTGTPTGGAVLAFPQAAGSMTAAAPLPDAVMLRLGPRDGGALALTLYDVAGAPCLVIDDLRLVAPDQCRDIRLDEEPVP